MTSPERPPLHPLARQHSRSSSQLATFASLALSPVSSPAPLLPPPTPPRASSSASGSRRGSRRPSTTSSDDSDDDRQGSSRERGRKASGSTEPTSSSSVENAPQSASQRPPQGLKERRSTLPPSLSLAQNPVLISTSPSPAASPVPSPLPPTDPATPAQASFPSASTTLAQFIQHRRRQASAPYFASARERSLFSPGAGFSLGSSAGSDAGPPSFAGPSERGASRSRASSRRGTTSGLSLTTSGLGSGSTDDLGLVATPTTEEWRQLGGEELVAHREEERLRRKSAGVGAAMLEAYKRTEREKKEKEVETAREQAASQSPVKQKWKKWPSLHDDSDAEGDEEGTSEDEEEENFALSLSLSRLSGPKGHQLPHTPPPQPSPPPAAKSEEPSRPSLPKQYKSSFSYSSSGAGANGGFVSHSNTNSISSLNAPLSSSNTPSAESPYEYQDGGEPPGSDPLPHAESFPIARSASAAASPYAATSFTSPSSPGDQKPKGHRLDRDGRKSEPQLVPMHRPALSRGSLSATVGGLGSPGSAPGSGGSQSVAMSPGPSSDQTTTGATPRISDGEGLGISDASKQNGDAEEGGRDHHRPHKIPIPPSVFRSLAEGSSAVPEGFAPTAAGPNGTAPPAEALVTPLSVAGTPYDGDPFSSLAPTFTSIPPTPAVAPSPSTSVDRSGAVSLDWTQPLGPVDPRTYSAVTGLREIGSFVVQGEEAGKGAYGSVRRARERGKDDTAFGPELIIKYVIKQRILADCWKKHKILGPIPIEVHVLDHLRRVPYTPRPRLNYLRSRYGNSSTPSIGSGSGSGIEGRNGKRGLPVRRDSAPRLDLWKGGEDGGEMRTGHPGICPLLDFMENDEHYLLVMPQATAPPTSSPSSTTSASQAPKTGQDLFDYVDAHPTGLPVSKIQDIFKQLVDAIWFLHEHSIVHRDIKDENVVLDAEGTVRLIDFGSAAYVREGKKFDTFSGTLDFAAPEVLKGARYGGKEQDIWALGVLGYVLVCGECPFWSPDEAMRGLSPDSRAYHALQAKLTSSPAVSAHFPTSPSTTPLPASSPSFAATNGSNKHSSTANSISMADAIDLVQRCLEIAPSDRPMADCVADHRFLIGREGWSGRRGWESALTPSEDGEDGEEEGVTDGV